MGTNLTFMNDSARAAYGPHTSLLHLASWRAKLIEEAGKQVGAEQEQ